MPTLARRKTTTNILAKMTKYSEEMKAYMDAHHIRPKQVLYLTIQRVHLERIIRGEKTVEFRDASDYYVKKFYEIENNEATALKPYTHILFQAGYSATSPRALVQFIDARVKEADATPPRTEIGKRMLAESFVEGFGLDDEWMGIALGKVEFTELF